MPGDVQRTMKIIMNERDRCNVLRWHWACFLVGAEEACVSGEWGTIREGWQVSIQATQEMGVLFQE